MISWTDKAYSGGLDFENSVLRLWCFNYFQGGGSRLLCPLTQYNLISSWQKKGGPAILMAPLLTNQIKESIYEVYDRCSWIEDWNDYCSLKLMLYNSFYISSKCVWRKSIPKGLGRDKRWYLENCYQKKVCRPILVILAGNSSLEHS